MTRELLGLTALFLAAFTLLSLVTFNAGDYARPVKVILNKAGPAGANWAGAWVELLGLGAYLVGLGLGWLGLRCFVPGLLRLPLSRKLGGAGLVLVLLTLLSSPWGIFGLAIGPIRGGGYCGQAIYDMLARNLSPFGAYFLLVFAFVAAVQLAFGLTWENFWGPVTRLLQALLWQAFEAWQAARERRRQALAARPPKPRPAPRSEAPMAETEHPVIETDASRREEPKPAQKSRTKDKEAAPKSQPSQQPAPVSPKQNSAKPGHPAPAVSDAPLPTLDLLTQPPVQDGPTVEPEVCRRQAESLITCLNDFGIQGEVQRVVPGPVVTMFEFKPAPGIKISRIVGLSVDMALAMKALAVRIEGPIPGKDTVGVEIPNAKRQTVYLREILDTDAFRASPSKITLAIGKDIHGRPQVADLARMPHLLVAGATGSGKSVCINGILLSILYKATPDEVKLLLVDPKRIELSVL